MEYDFHQEFRDLLNEGIENALWSMTPEELEKAVTDDGFEARVSAAVSDAIQAVATGLAESLNESAEAMLEDRRVHRQDFDRRLSEHWGRAFDLTEMVIKVAWEAGDFFNEKHAPNNGEPDPVFEALVRLHARACRLSEEILVLLKSGYGQAAHARWRALHEVAVVGDFIKENGPETAERYFAHEAVESWRGMQEFQLHAGELGDSPFTAEEELEARRAFEAVVDRYGPKFAGPYGWAHSALTWIVH